MPTMAEIANMKVGVWNITSGIDGTVDMSALFDDSDIHNLDECRVLTITAIAGATQATVEIDNRTPIYIPAGQAITVNPNGTIVNSIIDFTNTASYVIEFVTSNFHGSTKGNI